MASMTVKISTMMKINKNNQWGTSKDNVETHIHLFKERYHHQNDIFFFTSLFKCPLSNGLHDVIHAHFISNVHCNIDEFGMWTADKGN